MVDKFKEWYDEDEHDTFNYPVEAMENAWNNGRRQALKEAIEVIRSCELVEPNVMRIRLNEAVGALLGISVE